MEPTWTSGGCPGGGCADWAVTRKQGWGLENEVYETPGKLRCCWYFFAKPEEGTKKLVRWLHSGYMRGSLDSGVL